MLLYISDFKLEEYLVIENTHKSIQTPFWLDHSSGWFYDFTSHIHAVRNPSLIIELLTYEAMKEKKDATVKVWALLRMILIEWIKWIEMTSYIPWDVVYIQTEIRH